MSKERRLSPEPSPRQARKDAQSIQAELGFEIPQLGLITTILLVSIMFDRGETVATIGAIQEAKRRKDERNKLFNKTNHDNRAIAKKSSKNCHRLTLGDKNQGYLNISVDKRS